MVVGKEPGNIYLTGTRAYLTCQVSSLMAHIRQPNVEARQWATKAGKKAKPVKETEAKLTTFSMNCFIGVGLWWKEPTLG